MVDRTARCQCRVHRGRRRANTVEADLLKANADVRRFRPSAPSRSACVDQTRHGVAHRARAARGAQCPSRGASNDGAVFRPTMRPPLRELATRSAPAREERCRGCYSGWIWFSQPSLLFVGPMPGNASAHGGRSVVALMDAASLSCSSFSKEMRYLYACRPMAWLDPSSCARLKHSLMRSGPPPKNCP